MPAPAAKTDLAEEVGRYFYDPLGFVLFAFDWGHGDLERNDGPREWQAEYLRDLGAAVRANDFDGITPVSPVQMATASGHGIGKSTLTAWIILWIMSTRPHCKGVVTANTADQLKTKTWSELSKWRKRCITGTWFDLTTSKGNLSIVAVASPETWRFDGLTCREENSEAFAGQHAADSSSVYIFDEASAVPDAIWEVAEGGLTDGEPFWLVFGNPTRNTGRFRECFGRLAHRWDTRQIDSRTVPGANHEQAARWIEDYGEDSDFVRIRVRGVFPRASITQFIGSDVVEEARKREPFSDPGAPVVIGVDVAREGDDESVIAVRRGRDAQTVPWVHMREADTMRTAAAIVEAIKAHRPDAVFIDEGGVGGGVVDRVRQLGHAVIGVKFGAKADRSSTAGADAQGERFANKRAEMWGAMRAWLASGGAIPDDQDLADQLIGPEYGHTLKDEIILEAKKDMKKRGLASPDRADALALSFAYPVAPRPLRKDAADHVPHQAQTDYDPYANL